MIKQITERRAELAELCRRYKVRRLALFGSALREDFDAERSDLDFLVEFQTLVIGQYLPTFMGLRSGLSDLFARRVDLVIWQDVVNPYIRREVEATHRELYAA